MTHFQKGLRRFRFVAAILLIILFLTLMFLLKGKHYLLFSLMCLVCSILPMYWRFEHQELQTKVLVMVAILIALAVIGRVPFAFIPGFQAASTVIILSGYTLGPDLGFVIGATTALASNMFLGQGPWTPWQMFAWGLMGVGASFFATMKSKHAYPALIVYGGLAGFIYGWIMDLWYVLVYVHPLTPKSAFLGFAASFFPFDSFHAISNVVLVAALFPFWVRFFDQLMTKYRIQLPSHKTRR